MKIWAQHWSCNSGKQCWIELNIGLIKVQDVKGISNLRSFQKLFFILICLLTLVELYMLVSFYHFEMKNIKYRVLAVSLLDLQDKGVLYLLVVEVMLSCRV